MKTSFIYFMSRILGLYPFDRNGLSKMWLTISIALQILTATAYVLDYIETHTSIRKFKLAKYIDIVLLAAQWSTTICHFFRTIANRKVYDATIATVERKTPLWVNIVLAVQFTWSLLEICITISLRDFKKFLWKIVTHIHSTLTYFIALQFVCSVSAKSQEAKKLKKYIGKYPEASCAHLYKIVREVEEIHEAYGVQLLLVMSKLMTCAVYFGFQGLSTSSELDTGTSLLVTVENLSWVLFIQWSCGSFNQQITEFYAQLFCVIWTRECSNRKLCLHAIVQRNVEFRTCGFFTMGYPLFTSAIAATATYLVILLQFEY